MHFNAFDPAVTVDLAAAAYARMHQRAQEFAAEHAGRILEVWHESRSTWSDGGDYYDVLMAEVWNGEETERKTVTTNGDATWSRWPGSTLPVLPVDATPDTLAAVEAWQAREAAHEARREAAREAGVVTLWCLVVVTGGNKVPLWTVGVCTGLFPSMGRFGGYRARVSPVQADGSTPVDRDAVSYTDPRSLTVLMPAGDVRADWRVRVHETVVRRAPLARLAWWWASRDASTMSAEQLGARGANDLESFREVEARKLWCAYVDRLAALVGDAGDADLVAALESAFANPVYVEAGVAHDLPTVIDALTVAAEGAETGISWREVFSMHGPEETVPGPRKGSRPINVRDAAVTRAIRAQVGVVFEAPKAPRAKRARKGAEGAAPANDTGEGDPAAAAVA